LRHAGEIDIPNQPAVGQTIAADIDHHRAGSHHLWQEQD